MHIIGGLYRNHPIIAPKGTVTRPTSGTLREALFNICQQYIEGARFLDLFAGSGAMGLEALSRGAQKVYFIDNNREAIRCIKENLRKLKLEEKATVIYGDLFQCLAKLTEEQVAPFDIVYADPPYNAQFKKEGIPISYSQELLHRIDQSPLLAASGMFFIEEAKETQLLTSNLKNIQIKSNRKLGRSMLYQWIKPRCGS